MQEKAEKVPTEYIHSVRIEATKLILVHPGYTFQFFPSTDVHFAQGSQGVCVCVCSSH